MAARQTNSIEKDYDEDEQTLDRSSHRSSVRFLDYIDDEDERKIRMTSVDLEDSKMRTIIEQEYKLMC